MRRGATWLVSLLGALALAGCEKPLGPPPLEYALHSPYLGVQTLAIAPAVNVSGVREFDPLTVSDHMFSELQQVNGLTVLPVNKTIAAMAQLRLRTIDSPDTAKRLAQALGADGIVLVSVTLYDPYMPPSVGMRVELYTVRDASETMLDARRMDGSTLVAPVPAGQPRHLAASISALFNSSNQTVRAELRDFARGRTDYDSALREERFLADSDAYMRFVCHAMVRRLMEVERRRVAGR